MFSKLLFNVDGETIEFTAHDLILAAHQVVQEKKAAVSPDEFTLPDYKSTDQRLDSDFWSFSDKACALLDTHYQLLEGKTETFLGYAHEVCVKHPHLMFSIVTAPQNQALLRHIKAREKIPLIDFSLNEHVIIPVTTLKPATLNQWMWISRCLSEPHKLEQELKGWWFNIGTRIIRLRNDMVDGELPESNKQLYAADHGSVAYIMNHAQQAIERCLKNFTWGKDGSYYQAFNFWMYFELNNLSKFRIEFVERVGGTNLKDLAACTLVFDTLGKHGVNNELLAQEPQVPPHDIALRKTIYEVTFDDVFLASGQPIAIQTAHSEWMEKAFMAQLTDEMIEIYRAGGYFGQKEKYSTLLTNISYQLFRPSVVPYVKLKDKEKKEREAVFDKILNQKKQQHQSALREEFVALMSDDIAHSPIKCARLMMTLGSVYKECRGSVSDDSWSKAREMFIGERSPLKTPSTQTPNLENDKRRLYESIFDALVEDFRYITEAVLRQHVISMFERDLNPFFTQVNQVMHPTDAEKYIMAYTLLGLAKSINRGNHEPLLRELTAYGDPDAGNSYHKFELSISDYFKSPQALSESELAVKMRQILAGSTDISEQLAFLPALTAGWFISESSRNDITTMTSLMLLDFIEGKVVLNTPNGLNWYTWSHTLIHPLKPLGVKDVNDLYGKSCEGIDRFGGCHPMANQGSVQQTTTLPDYKHPLTVSRQKEGHLLIHWLERRLALSSDEEKAKCHVQGIKCSQTQGNYIPHTNMQELVSKLESKKKSRDKELKTIHIKKKNDPDTPVDKQLKSIAKLEKEIAELETKVNNLETSEKAKKHILDALILPALRQRLSSLDNLLVEAPIYVNDVDQQANPDSKNEDAPHSPLTMFFHSSQTGKKQTTHDCEKFEVDEADEVDSCEC